MRTTYFYILLLVTSLSWSQTPDSLRAATEVDRDLIKIGEEVKLGITVEATRSDLVVFPEQQTLGGLEVINSYPVDSLRLADKIQLFKQYGVTQFDSGDYWIPQLKILKNSAQLYSDSVLISVREVVVLIWL